MEDPKKEMEDPKKEIVPFVSFNFSVEINRTGRPDSLVSAAFAECDGLEITMDVKTIREGGNNGRQIRLTGAYNFGQLTLKRGMTENFDLWDWVTDTLHDPSLRAEAEVVILAPKVAVNEGAKRSKIASFLLSRCLPIKLKAPPLNAKDGMIAVEELQLAYESLTLKKD